MTYCLNLSYPKGLTTANSHKSRSLNFTCHTIPGKRSLGRQSWRGAGGPIADKLESEGAGGSAQVGVEVARPAAETGLLNSNSPKPEGRGCSDLWRLLASAHCGTKQWSSSSVQDAQDTVNPTDDQHLVFRAQRPALYFYRSQSVVASQRPSSCRTSTTPARMMRRLSAGQGNLLCQQTARLGRTLTKTE